MFAGAGDFFKPLDPRKELSAIAAVRPAPRTGEDGRGKSGGGSAPETPDDFSADGAAGAGSRGDDISLSIAALFVLLTGRAPRSSFTCAEAAHDPAAHRALDAYHRAGEALPPRPDMAPPQPALDAGGDIFYMLAALEKAGVTALSVSDGQTIYDALRARCRRLNITLAAPVAAPDNAIDR
jgi:hypothetical protein